MQQIKSRIVVVSAEHLAQFGPRTKPCDDQKWESRRSTPDQDSHCHCFWATRSQCSSRFSIRNDEQENYN